MEPEDGLDWFRENGPPEHIVLSNRHHDRDSAKFVEAFGCTVHASRPGMHEFAEKELEVEPFDYGDELPGGVKAYEAGAICPDDTALHIPARFSPGGRRRRDQLRRPGLCSRRSTWATTSTR